jgi:hypothetical protein
MMTRQIGSLEIFNVKKEMAKQKRTAGSILEIDLGNGYYNYAQIINADILFFDIYTAERISDVNVLNDKKPLFFLGVYDKAITGGRWKKIGSLPIKDAYKQTPMKFIQDALQPEKFELYDPNTGETLPASRKQVENLECAAVWEPEHVESRIRDYYNGVPNIWVEQMKPK